ncbi:MAG: Maf family protein [Desulfobacterota bacterium]|nr:Maf family protein [Thermodesulfobacteriota bacterium]
MKPRLILASASPRRFELLRQLGLDFEAVPSEVEEESLPGESPRDHVTRLAGAKALEVAKRFPEAWVIGADTIVFIDGLILGKPKGREEAIRMLRLLSGREHRVLSGLSVHHLLKGRSATEVVESSVRIKRLRPEEMEWYVDTGEPFDKAGGYGVQGIGAFMIEAVMGSYTNVVGLPLCELMEMLLGLGALTISEQGFRILD